MVRAVRIILRQAKTESFTARQHRDRFATIVNIRHIQQLLAADHYFS